MAYTGLRITPEGGFAIRLTNKTGGATVKGYVVSVYSASAIDKAFKNVPIDAADPIGVIYEAGIADGSECWVVVAGIADVYFVGDTVLGHFARVTVAGDTGAAAGQAISEALPGSPFATDKHFQEVGHVAEARSGAGLAKVILHFN